jgi:hypothetical protein
MFDGKCKDVCAENEEAVIGAFMDCTDKQECCVLKKDAKNIVVPERTEKENKKYK